MKTIQKYTMAAMATALCSSSAFAQTAVSLAYDFDTAVGVATGDVSGADAVLNIGTLNAGAVNVLGNASTSTSLADAVTAGEYTSIIFTAGLQDVQLTDLVFDSFSFNANTDTFSVAAFSASTGFAEADVLASSTLIAVGGANSATDSVTVSLTGTVAAGTSEEFRFYFVDGSTGGGRATNLDSVTISGTVATAVPEPASTALLGLGGLLLVVRRRR